MVTVCCNRETVAMSDSLDLVVLRNGALECVVCPHIGGSIARLTLWDGGKPLHLFRPAPAEALDRGSAIDMGCFPLVPFSNRIAAGRFQFNGTNVSLPLNQPPCPHTIHGHAWATPWRIDEQDDHAVTLAYRHAADAWPWSYSASQSVVLGPDRLDIRLDLVNEGDSPMPAGFGLHPYLPKPPGTRLTAGVGSVWLGDATLLPRERASLPGHWDLRAGLCMDRVVVDNDFAGWDGCAVVDWPGRRRRLIVDADPAFTHLVVYAPEGGDYLCVEPVTHMTDAVNHADEPDAGLRTLSPGQRLTGSVRFQVQ